MVKPKNMLRKKLYRDMSRAAMQFLSIIALCALGTFAFSALDGMARMIRTTLNTYYEENNLADFWITLPTADRASMEKLAALPDVEAVCAGARRVAVLEGVADSTNVGALFRSAAALGVDAILATPTCCDPFCRRAVRVSMGTVFQVPWTYIGDAPGDWPERGIARLRALGFRTAAMALTDDSVSIEDEALMAEPKLAIVLGTEGDGLAQTTIAACDYTVKIPMSHKVDSLNVAAAGALAFWQLRAR